MSGRFSGLKRNATSKDDDDGDDIDKGYKESSDMVCGW